MAASSTKSSLDLSSLKPYAAPLLAVVVIALAVPLAIMPGFGDIQKGWDDISAKKTVLDQMKAKVAQLDGMDDAKNRALLQDWAEPAVPSDTSAAGLLGMMETMAQRNGLQSRSTSYSGTAPSDAASALAPTGSITVNLAVAGSYENLTKFIAATEKALRLTSIDTMTISKDESEGGNSTLQATLTVTSPYALPTIDLGPEETPLPTLDVSDSSPILLRVKTFTPSLAQGTPITNITGKLNPFK